MVIDFFFSKDFFRYRNNRFLFSHSLKISEIRQFIKNYKKEINQFFNDNNLTTKEIEEEELNIIVCDKNFNEFTNKELKFLNFLSYSSKEIKLIKKIIGLMKIDQVPYRYCYGLKTIMYVKNSDYGFIDSNKNLILPYHYHLIYTNIINSQKLPYDINSGILNNVDKNVKYDIKDYFTGIFIIESVESFYSFVLFHLKENEFLIDENLINKFLSYYENQKTPYDNFEQFYIDFITDSLKLDMDAKIIIQNKFIESLIKNYGLNKLKIFINSLYNSEITSFNETFKKVYNIDFIEFMKKVI